MIPEAVIASVTLITVTSLLVARSLSLPAKPVVEKLRSRPSGGADGPCGLCGANFHFKVGRLSVEAVDGLLCWSCPQCKGSYKTRTAK